MGSKLNNSEKYKMGKQWVSKIISQLSIRNIKRLQR